MSGLADGRVIIEAILDTANVSKNVSNLGKELNGISWKNISEGDEKAKALSGAFKSAGTACTLSLTAPIVAAGTAAFGVASSYEQSASRIQASIVDLGGDVEALTESAANIYEGGFGSSLDEVTDAVIRVKQAFGDIKPEIVEDITESCLMLSDTMGMDVDESIRGVSALMTAFGMDADAALDLFVSGAQNGLDYSGELGDNLAEYATLFEESGYSASEMFSILDAGVKSGAYNLDKVNDLVKEFGVRMADGSVATACEELGGNFKTLYDEAQAAGMSNKETFSLLAGEIQNLGSEQEKAAAISAIWGSQGEDNGIKVIEAMAGVTDSYGNVEGAADAAKQAACDNFANQSESAMRTLLGSLEPLGEPLVNIATGIAGVVKTFGEWFASIGSGGQMAVMVILGIVAAIGPMLTMAGNVVGAISTIKGALTAMKGAQAAATAATGAQTVAQHGLNTAMKANPVGIVITLIMGLISALVYLWNTNEGFRNAVTAIWEAIWGFIGPIIEGIGAGLTWLGDTLGGVWDFITGKTSESGTQMASDASIAFGSMQSSASGAMSTIGTTMDGALSNMQASSGTAWSSIASGTSSSLYAMESTTGSTMANMSSLFGGSLDGMDSASASTWSSIVSGTGADLSSLESMTGSTASSMESLMSGSFGNMDGDASSAMGSIKSSMSSGMRDASRAVSNEMLAAVRELTSAMKQMTDQVSTGIGSMEGKFSGASFSFPHIPLPHFTVSGEFSLNPPSIPSFGINWYAKGSVFNGPSVIGVGEAGPEAVVPLSGKSMLPFAEAVAKQMPGSDTGGNITINIERFVHSGSERDDEELLRRIAQKIKSKQRAGGFA